MLFKIEYELFVLELLGEGRIYKFRILEFYFKFVELDCIFLIGILGVFDVD